MAASTMPWLGTSAAATKSTEPAPWGLARPWKATIATAMATAAMQIRTMPAGGRLRLAVPNSSPMWNSVTGSGAGVRAGADGGGVDGSDIVPLDNGGSDNGGSGDG